MTTATEAAMRLIAATLRISDPSLTVLPLVPTSWLTPQEDAVYVSVELANLGPDGWVETTAILVTTDRSDVLAPAVTIHSNGTSNSVSPGATIWGSDRPATLYGPGVVVAKYSNGGALGNAARSRASFRGWMPGNVEKWDDEAARNSLRTVLLDLSDQQSWACMKSWRAPKAVDDGLARWSVGIKPTATVLEYAVSVSALLNDVDVAELKSGGNFISVTAAEVIENLEPRIGNLVVPSLGTLIGLKAADEHYVTLNFERPEVQE